MIRVVIAFLYRNGNCGRAYAKVIEDSSTKSLRSIFDQHIGTQAHILEVWWTGCKPLVEDYPNLKQILSEKERNCLMLHKQIRNFKNWLRSVY